MAVKKLQIVKIGGALVNDEHLLNQALDAFNKLESPKILVHGGGRKATELAKSLDIPVKMIDGRRITDEATLEIAVMVYAGISNKTIVAKLQAAGTNAIGLSGADADLIRSHKRMVKTIDYGYVGDIIQINDQWLQALLDTHATPVLCAITHDGEGQLLNTNADTIAAVIAKAMSRYYEVHLRYCFEYKGVLQDVHDPDASIPQISKNDMSHMIREETIHSGMIPKLTNGFDALGGGVTSVAICGISNLQSLADATMLSLR